MSTLVLGGARSGKSSFAESLAKNFNAVTYVATAVAVDQEIEKRIERHKSNRPKHWQTIEAPIHLGHALLAEMNNEPDCILIDCLTFWVNNCLYNSYDTWLREKKVFIEALAQINCEVIMVSNEVGTGITPIGKETREFVDEIGWAHQELAQLVDLVVYVVAGIPQILKGELPTINS